ncbi:MAG: twin-arginine translocase TatA/TatE family subunit [Acidimicrobiales bacterium]
MSVSSTEIIVVLLVALIVLGPNQLPDAMRRLGSAYREFKKISSSVQNEINSVVSETTGMFTSTADTVSGRAEVKSTGGSDDQDDFDGTLPKSNQSYRPADEDLDAPEDA